MVFVIHEKQRTIFTVTSPDKTSVSEMKIAIKKIMTDFYRRKQEKEIGWLTGVTCRMFADGKISERQ